MVSLCIISRKEDKDNLGRAIASCSRYVDEIVIIDTGSDPIELVPTGRERLEKNDHQVASDFGLVNLVPFEWAGDFAAARNFSFEQAKGDVIFWIDSDDIVTNPEAIPKLAKQIEDGKADWIYSQYNYQRDEAGNLIAKHWKARMFRKGTGRWVGDVHEDFMPSQAVVQKKDADLLPEGLVVEHQATEKDLQEHSQRNLDIQLKEVARDGDKVDPRTLMYLGMSYQGLKEWEKSVYWFMRHVKATGSKEDKFWSLYRISLCFHFLGSNDQALNFALDSLKLFPQWKSSYFLVAAIYTALEDWPKVVEWTLTGLEKSDPDTLQVVSEIDYTILPLGRLAMAYLQTGNYGLAAETAADVYRMNPRYQGSKELVRMCTEAVKLEGFVTSFLEVVNNFKVYDRVKATKLFDLVPKELDDDYRIQGARNLLAAPKAWPEKSVAIYCGRTIEEWSYPSVFAGIGGSEKAVIHMAKELARKGFSVTVYNRCGDMKGTYDGVEYLPYYFFNRKDSFDTLIVWRNPLAFADGFKARRKYLWLHDIARPEQFNGAIYGNVDKVFFLSKWHRANLPGCPEEKAFVTNNGVDPDDFKDLPPKRNNSLIWSSSYDRGLLPFIKNILPLIKREVPDVTLDVAYGWDNIRKEMDLVPSLRKLYEELSPILENTPGIIHHGRLSHKKLAKLMGSSMVYPYASEFGETNNMTSQECQAAGCYVITTKQAGGTSERVRFGKVLDAAGIYTDKQSQKDFAHAVVLYLQSSQPEPKRTDVFRDLSWEATARQWINELGL